MSISAYLYSLFEPPGDTTGRPRLGQNGHPEGDWEALIEEWETERSVLRSTGQYQQLIRSAPVELFTMLVRRHFHLGRTYSELGPLGQACLTTTILPH